MTYYGGRETCFKCFRPKDSCICQHIHPISTQSHFIILMHPKEFKKTKNITGHMSHLSLPNSQLFVGDDFSQHKALNHLLNDEKYQAFILYPDTKAVNLSQHPLPQEKNKTSLFILIDSTWACSKKMMRLSSNLQHLPKVSFTTTKLSQFHIKRQPDKACLSTIETIHTLLTILNEQKIETIKPTHLDNFLKPFHTMVNYQLSKIAKESSVRFKKW